jgi:hypothetical protein
MWLAEKTERRGARLLRLDNSGSFYEVFDFRIARRSGGNTMGL